MKTELEDGLAEVLRGAGKAHHDAFAATDGADPDWPIWYANHLRDDLETRFGIDVTRSYLVYCLIKADMEHQARAPEAEWAAFYAGEFLDHLSMDHETGDRLALYYMPTCPFCIMVMQVIDELGLEIDFRDVSASAEHRADLLAARGRATVPVLRITPPEGEDRWMPESRDIMRYLKETFGASGGKGA